MDYSGRGKSRGQEGPVFRGIPEVGDLQPRPALLRGLMSHEPGGTIAGSRPGMVRRKVVRDRRSHEVIRKELV